MLITDGVCMGCGGPRERALADVSAMADLEPVYMAGQWDRCCGWPVQLIASPRRRPYCHPWGDVWIGPSAPYPDVSTPDDLLRHAGLLIGLP